LSNPQDLVVDIFAGSGTTAIACEELNRKWICVEKDDGYFDIARNRIKNTDTMLLT
jgi:DNA modification methylase